MVQRNGLRKKFLFSNKLIITISLYKKLIFPLRISSLNVTISARNCRFDHIDWKNLKWKTSLLCSILSRFKALHTFAFVSRDYLLLTCSLCLGLSLTIMILLFQTLHKKMRFSIKDFFSKCDQIRCETYLSLEIIITRVKKVRKLFTNCRQTTISI